MKLTKLQVMGFILFLLATIILIKLEINFWGTTRWKIYVNNWKEILLCVGLYVISVYFILKDKLK